MDTEKRPAAERYAWSQYARVSDELEEMILADQEYLSTMFGSLSVVRDNELGLKITKEFIWEFVGIKGIAGKDKKFHYITTVSYDEEKFKEGKNPWCHKTPWGEVLYHTKKNNGGHIVLEFIPITRKYYKIDTDKEDFVINEKNLKWVEADKMTASRLRVEGWYVPV